LDEGLKSNVVESKDGMEGLQSRGQRPKVRDAQIGSLDRDVEIDAGIPTGRQLVVAIVSLNKKL